MKIVGALIHVILSLWNTQNKIKNIIILKAMTLGIEPFMYILHKLHVCVYMDDLNKSRKCWWYRETLEMCIFFFDHVFIDIHLLKCMHHILLTLDQYCISILINIKCALDRMEVEPFNFYRLCTCRDICSLAGFSLGNLKYIYVNIVLIVISNPFARF